jgi:hypothetical protein
MASLEQLGQALVNADAAGDTAAARALAGEIMRLRQTTAAPEAPQQSVEPSTMEGTSVYTAGGPGLGEELRRVGGVLDKGARMAAGGATFGLADKFAGGMDYLTGRAKSYDEGVKAQRAETQAIREASPGPAAVAEAVGGLGTGAGLIRSGITLAGRAGPRLLPRVLGYGTEGAAYGAAHGAGNTYSDKIGDYVENAKNSGALGLLVGGALPLAGAAASGAYRAGSAFLGPRVEGASRGASSLLRTAAQADEAGLRGLSSMGPEAMLVDAGPAMKGLGQGAGTGTGSGRTALVEALQRRDAGTGNRLATVLDENLGRSPVPSQVEAGLAGARQELAPAYQQVFQGARPVDTSVLAERLNAIAVAERGPAQRAVRQVREMLNDPVATRELDRNPAALLNTRQAIDGMLTNEVDPNTIRVLTQARQAVDTELANAVPGIKAVDAQFAELSRQSAGLQRGSQVLDSGKTAIRPVELADEISASALPQGEMIGPSGAPLRLRQGARAEVDRIVGTNVNDLNALERKLGTPQDWNAQKMATVFGEGAAARVAKALMDNRQFRQSYQDIVQNSQTAQRQEAAKAMRGAEGGVVPHDTTMTGLGLKAINLIAKAISGASSATTKDEVGRLLASQGPAVERIAQELLRSAQTAATNSRAISGLVGSQRWIGALAPAEGRSDNRSKTR